MGSNDKLMLPQVLLCDIRDVLFQLDPFESLAVADGIGVAVWHFLSSQYLFTSACSRAISVLN
jgi:hypothetical protein